MCTVYATMVSLLWLQFVMPHSVGKVLPVNPCNQIITYVYLQVTQCMHIICNAFIMKICGKFQLSLFLAHSLSEYLLLTLSRVAFATAYAKYMLAQLLFFSGLISLPWQPNDSCFCVFVCRCVCVCVCRCHRSMPAAVTLDIYLLILLILLKSAAHAGSLAK